MDFLENELYHHGIKGQHWGIRRFQNEDGSLTSAGRKRYNVGDKMDTNDPNDSAVTRKVKRNYNDMTDKEFMNRYKVSKKTYMKRVNKYGDPYMNSPISKRKQEKRKKEAARIQKDIDYFSENKNGIYFNNGKLMLSKQEISDILKELEKQKDTLVSDSDPYMNSPRVKRKQEKRKKELKTVQSDIDYFSENKNGIYYDNGKLMLSKQEISGILKELEKQKDTLVSEIAKVDEFEFG